MADAPCRNHPVVMTRRTSSARPYLNNEGFHVESADGKQALEKPTAP
jgi:hypothetical protein